MMLKVDARGDACPLPVVKAKKAISELKGAGEVEVLVDNEIAVQNLTKMAQQKGYQYSAEKLAEREYRVQYTDGEASETPTEEAPACAPDTRTDTVVAISSDKMGIGADDLGKSLLKAFVFALTQQDQLPKTVLFYNGGASLTCEGSPMLDDLKALEAQGKKFCDNNAQDIAGFIQKQQKDSGLKVQDAEKLVRDLKIPF